MPSSKRSVRCDVLLLRVHLMCSLPSLTRFASLLYKDFDLFSSEDLPRCDILVAADVLYNSELATQVGIRLHEVITRTLGDDDSTSKPPKIIITDSQKFHGTDFLMEVQELVELNKLFREHGAEELRWETQTLKNVTGSGVLIDEDQSYDVDVKTICWGWSA